MIKQLFSCILIVSITINAFSQNIPDSLSSKLSGKSPKDQVNYLCNVSNSCLKSNPSASFELAKTAVGIASKNGDKNGEYKASVLAGRASRYANRPSEGISYYNSAITILSSANQKKVLASVYNELGLSYRDANKFSDATNAFSKSSVLYEELGDTKTQYSVVNNLGGAYVKAGQNKQALDAFSKAKTLAEKLGDKKEVASSLNQLGVAYANYGNNQEALRCFNSAKDIASSLNMTALIATIDKNINGLQNNLANKEKSKTSYDQEQQQQQQQMVTDLQNQYLAVKEENLKSFEEIEKLSVENQAKEYKLRAIQGEVEKQKLENQLKEQSLKTLEAEKKQKDAEINRQNETLAYQNKVLIIIASALVLVVLLLMVIIRLYISNKKTLKLVRKQKVQIEKQKDEIEGINKELTHQNTIIRESIDYAKHIQFALLPNIALIKQVLPNFFVFFKPRDVVSGDFYWFNKSGNTSILATIDCTGHGVPGALMSLIANSMLNKIIKEKQILDPALVLESLNKEVLEAMSQSGDDLDNGMDITVCTIYQNENRMDIAMAGHSCLIIYNNDIQELEGKDFSIGGVFASPDSKYEKHSVELKQGLSCYFFSDGFADQTGGPDKKKLGQKALNEIILSANSLEISKRNEVFEKSLAEWKGENKQVDDIIVIGFTV